MGKGSKTAERQFFTRTTRGAMSIGGGGFSFPVFEVDVGTNSKSWPSLLRSKQLRKEKELRAGIRILENPNYGIWAGGAKIS